MERPRCSTTSFEENENGTRIGGLKDPMNPSERVDQLIAGLTDWRGKTLASVRKIILEADREIIEEWKWMGSPVWSHDGMIALGNAHKDKVKAYLFPRGEPPRS
jgi:hypothetical protein